jgi:5-methylcytosine-specific restriction endonuclease McrA
VDRTQRTRLADRDGAGCVLCGETSRPLHVGHLISVADGRAHGLTDEQLWSDANLAIMCESCNLALGRRSVSLQFIVALRLEWERRSA